MAKNDKHTRGSTSPKAGEEYRLDFSFCDTHRATQTLWGTIKAAQIRAHPDMKKKKKRDGNKHCEQGETSSRNNKPGFLPVGVSLRPGWGLHPDSPPLCFSLEGSVCTRQLTAI